MPVPDDLIAALRRHLGADLVSTGESDRAAHAEDGFGAQRSRPPSWEELLGPPIAVVRPRTAEDVAALLRLAAELGFAVVPYGGGTGLMAGAVSVREPRPTVVLALDAMRRIRELRPADRLVWAEAGATLAEVDEALRPHGLMAGHDPWTFNVATVGGAISTDGLGYLGGSYGSMGEQVLAVEAVLPSGDIVRTRAVPKRSTGFDLRRLFIGTEGTLGVVTAAALRAFPIPEQRQLRGYRFPDFEHGLDAVAAMATIGLRPAVLDFGQSFPLPPASQLRRALGPRGEREAAADMQVGFEGFREGVAASMARADGVCREHGGAPLPETVTAVFWEGRHDIGDRFAGRRAGKPAPPAPPGGVCLDFVHVALPASRVAGYWQEARALCEREGIAVLEAGLWAMPELFSLVLAGAAGSLAATLDALLQCAHRHDGSMEYCHGVGLRLAHLMAEEHGGEGLRAMRALKKALDPRGVLNPGKLALDSSLALFGPSVRLRPEQDPSAGTHKDTL